MSDVDISRNRVQALAADATSEAWDVDVAATLRALRAALDAAEQRALLEGVERKAAIRLAREANEKAMRAAELEDERDAARAEAKARRLPAAMPADWFMKLVTASQEHDETNRMSGREGERLRVLRLYDLLAGLQDHAAALAKEASHG